MYVCVWVIEWLNKKMILILLSKHILFAYTQCFVFLVDGALSLIAGWSAIRFKIIVAVHGLIMRWFDVDERVVRLLTAFAICSSEFFELFDSSRRRRKSTTWAFSSLICMEQFRSFCACRFWMPITLFNWVLWKKNGWKTKTFQCVLLSRTDLILFNFVLPFSLPP